MDLVNSLSTLLVWILYVGEVLSVGLLIVSLLLAAFGKWNSKIFFSALAGILIASSASLLHNAMVEGISLQEPYTLIATLITFGFIVASVVSFGLGNPDRGTKYFLAAALSAGFFAAVPAIQALFSEQGALPVGACVLNVIKSESSGNTVSLSLQMTYGRGNYNLEVLWGDGARSTASISPGSTVNLQHSYASAGSYGIVATARSPDSGECSVAVGANINPNLPWYAAILDPSGTTNMINQLIQIPYQLFYTAPEFDTSENSNDMKIYQTVTAIAISFIGLFIVLRFASGFFSQDPAESLVDSIKDSILVVVIILIAPYLYQIFSSMCNMVAISASKFSDLGNPAGLATVVALIASSVVLGAVSSFFGTVGGVLTVSLFMASVMAMIRFALIKGILLCTPLLAVAFLFPVARGAVRFVVGLLIALVLAGPVAAFVLVGLGTLPGVGGIVQFFAPAIAIVAFPFIFTAASGSFQLPWASTGLARIGAGIVPSLSPGDRGRSGAAVVNNNSPPNGGSGSSTGTMRIEQDTTNASRMKIEQDTSNANLQAPRQSEFKRMIEPHHNNSQSQERRVVEEDGLLLQRASVENRSHEDRSPAINTQTENSSREDRNPENTLSERQIEEENDSSSNSSPVPSEPVRMGLRERYNRYVETKVAPLFQKGPIRFISNSLEVGHNIATGQSNPYLSTVRGRKSYDANKAKEEYYDTRTEILSQLAEWAEPEGRE